MSSIIALFVWFVSWPFVSMWRSYVVICLWGWFVAPVIGIAAPSIYVITGFMMTIFAILPFQRVPKNEDDPVVSIITSLLLYGLIGPAMMLGCGWTWKWLQWGIA